MKGWTVLCMFMVMALCGCASSYVITLQNGRQVTAATKPKLQNGFYVYKDGSGKAYYVPEGRVRQISPASMAKDGSGGSFKQGPGQ